MEEEIRLATTIIQSQERLLLFIDSSVSEANGITKQDLDLGKEQASKCLNALREQKSFLEKSDVDFSPLCLRTDDLVELKQLVLMHIPSSLNAETCTKITHLVQSAFNGQCKAILSITLLTCPWYELSKRERGEQAKHNILYIIFTSADEHFFAPANSQIREEASVIDLAWLCAIELTHFGRALARGLTRSVQALHCSKEAEIFSTQEWNNLKQNLTFLKIAGTKTFKQACLGQALGVGKKKKQGAFKLRPGTSIFKICQSFRLCHLVEQALKQNDDISTVDESQLSLVASKAVDLICQFYDHPDSVKCKHELFDLLCQWVNELKADHRVIEMDSDKKNQTFISTTLGSWLTSTRLQGKKIKPFAALPDDHSQLLKIMQEIGGPMAKIQPEQILLVTIAGSALYNLKVPDSDVDYLVVYALPTETLLSATSKVQECYECRGQHQVIEYGAYEARTFCEMLLKCSVILLEILYTDEHVYSNHLWQELSKHKKEFVTEKAILQYLGLIKNNMKSIATGKLVHSVKRDRKLFYQNFHKLHCLQYMMTGEVPPVRLNGPIRDFVMNVRTQHEGEWSRESILKQLHDQYRDVKEKLAQRESRLKENPDYNLCMQWLMTCRGL
ncbi:uncharacterized protein LOC106070901 isoform X1 [Biomphalaria glabrata]|uniref:Uncharacterized protein LOC106070901 isoform X1 n=2 Tax=Biomphalaria glabrata TaxID=6526 RepID=A0A9U8EG50_BIOGL|nr:uncharacterized protein LOC106070901 isoform X1 [Biomphalaria glabrata]XP_013086343.2 uncharacterized protein LOC106070901 isoform X1 [Biomphalaria glabrata]